MRQYSFTVALLALTSSSLLEASAQTATAPQERRATDRIERTSLDAAELQRLAGKPILGGALVLHSGEQVSFELSAPHPTRSIGVWWEGQLGSTFITPLDDERAALGHWPVIEDFDQAPEHTEDQGQRPAGRSRISSLTHVYSERAGGARLDLFGPLRLESLDLIWIDVADPNLRQSASSGYAGSYAKPFVYSRSFWNADAPQCGVSYCNVTHLCVHHTASPSDYDASTVSQAAGNVKSTQAYHMYTNGWCDIGYNYLISKQGWIFEGRAGGDDVKGAHDGKNCGSMGVSALGYFHSPHNDAPTSPMLDAYAELFAWKAAQKNIDPFGVSFYAGLGSSESNVYGHRDVSATACPGDLLYVQIPGLRTSISNKLNGGGPGPTSGTLKGVLYNAALGTSARIAGGTVALADGTFRVTGADGYYEFPLPSGTHLVGGTAGGYTSGSSSEAVTSGDVWESLGLWPSSNVSDHWITPLGTESFQGAFQGDPNSPTWLGYAGNPGLPTLPLGGLGNAWPALDSYQVLYLGNLPSSGLGAWNFTVTGITPGLTLHTQGYLLWGGQWRLTSGAAWLAE